MTTVLYVDDEEPLRRALRSWLTKRGHTVFIAGSSAEARAVLETQHVDGAVIDVWLGRERGTDLFAWIQQHREELAPHVVFASGGAIADPDVEQTLARANLRVLTKPFDLAELERIVAAWDKP